MLTPGSSDKEIKTWILCDVKSADGKAVGLCDFGSVGVAGTFYRSWLKVRYEEITSNEFTKENPLRSFRP